MSGGTTPHTVTYVEVLSLQTRRNSILGSRLIWNWLDPRICLEALEKSEISFPCRYQWLHLWEGFNIEQKLIYSRNAPLKEQVYQFWGLYFLKAILLFNRYLININISTARKITGEWTSPVWRRVCEKCPWPYQESNPFLLADSQMLLLPSYPGQG
jgi:hypothetical protein